MGWPWVGLVSGIEVAYANNSCLHTSCNFPSTTVCTCVAVIGLFCAIPKQKVVVFTNTITNIGIHCITIHEHVCNKWLSDTFNNIMNFITMNHTKY